MSLRDRGSLPFFLGAVLLLAGCASQPVPEVTSEPPVDAMPAIASTSDIRLPLDAYALTYRERSALALAEARLTKECAKRFGLAYERSAGEVLRGAIVPFSFDSNEARHAYRFYHNDLAAARNTGFVSFPGPPHDLPTSSSEPQTPTKDDAYTRLVIGGLEQGPTPPRLDGSGGRAEAGPGGGYPTGVKRPTDAREDALPEGGCAGEARSILAGDGELHDLFYANNVGNKAYIRAIDDSRVRDVTRRWSECMSQRGYDYADPDEAGGDPKWLGLDAAARPTPEEIPVATADVECKQSVNYLGVRVAIETAYQNLVIEEHFQDLERNYRNAQGMLRRANEWIEADEK